MRLPSLLTDLHLADPAWAIIELTAPGGARFSAGAGGYLHIVLAGSLYLKLAGQRMAMEAGPGTAVFVLGADGHGMLSHPDSMTTPVAYFDTPGPADRIGVIRVGDTGRGCPGRCLTAAFHVDKATSGRLRHLLPGALCGKALVMTLADAVPIADTAEQAAGPGGATFLQRLGDLLLIQAIRGHFRDWEQAMQGAGGPDNLPSSISEAMRLMNGRPDQQWTLATLARQVKMSRSSFAAAFSAGVGEPPMAYLTRIRMQRAAELVSGSRLPLANICVSVGFNSMPSFSRLFKRWHGKPPGAYRKADPQEKGASAFLPGDHWAMFM